VSLLAIIPCLNEAEHLEALLTNLLEDTAIDMLVVADGGSVDDSKAIVGAFSQRDNRVKLIDNPAKIQSAGVNAAVAAFGQGHDWLLRVDAHCVYPRDYARTLLTSAQKNGADAVVVPMHTKGVAGFQLAAAAAQNSVLGTGGSAHRAGGEGQFIDHGHHALMHMDLFRKVGGYCEAMPCNEDAELDHRLGQVGGKIWLEPLATGMGLCLSVLGGCDWHSSRRRISPVRRLCRGDYARIMGYRISVGIFSEPESRPAAIWSFAENLKLSPIGQMLIAPTRSAICDLFDIASADIFGLHRNHRMIERPGPFFQCARAP